MCLFVYFRFKCIFGSGERSNEGCIHDDSSAFYSARVRSKPAEIFCDNGRNFVAAAKDIDNFLKVAQEPVSDFARRHSINIMFIRTYAPLFGGIWEAGIMSAKFHLKRIIGNSHVTSEKILTLFAQIESNLNSRLL